MTQGAYRTRLLLTVGGERWLKDIDLPIAPFPGLGLRVDTYDILNVVSVSVGPAADSGIECTVAEDEPAAGLTEHHCLSFGFRREPELSPPPAPGGHPVPAVLIVVDEALGTWQRTLALPFPPFADLGIRLAADTGAGGGEATVFAVVVGDRHGPVTCLATFAEAHRPASQQDLEAQGFEESLYP